MPEDERLWLEHDEDRAVLRHCGCWMSLAGLPDIEQDSKVVHIPRTQMLDAGQLRGLMDRMQRGEPL